MEFTAKYFKNATKIPWGNLRRRYRAWKIRKYVRAMGRVFERSIPPKRNWFDLGFRTDSEVLYGEADPVVSKHQEGRAVDVVWGKSPVMEMIEAQEAMKRAVAETVRVPDAMLLCEKPYTATEVALQRDEARYRHPELRPGFLNSFTQNWLRQMLLDDFFDPSKNRRIR